MKVDMPERYRKFKRTWGTYYVYDNLTGNSATLRPFFRNHASRNCLGFVFQSTCGGCRPGPLGAHQTGQFSRNDQHAISVSMAWSPSSDNSGNFTYTLASTTGGSADDSVRRLRLGLAVGGGHVVNGIRGNNLITPGKPVLGRFGRLRARCGEHEPGRDGHLD